MSETESREPLVGPIIMLFSALLFGYFGFASSYAYRGSAGQLLVYVPLFEWTLKVSAVAFALAAALTVVRPRAGNVLYGVIGLLGAGLLVVVVIMDLRDRQHTVMPPLLVLAFAAWNGIGSWMGLRALAAGRRAGPDPGERELEPPL